MQKKRFDQHLHSSFSYDGEQGNAISDIVETALDRGLAGIAVTDHLDPLWPADDYPNSLDLPAYETALSEAEERYAGRIPFAKGIEVGLMPGEAIDICRRAVTGYPYDFVIGSVHSSPETPFDLPPFLEGRALRDIIEEYYTLFLECLRLYKNYDVLGHINSIDRYTDGFAPEELYMPYVDEILKLAIEDGKGIEINTSAFRYGLGKRCTPPQNVINRFKELGGEIITIGSDAHTNADIGADLEKGEEMLLAAGFRYTAVFMERRPEFIRVK